MSISKFKDYLLLEKNFSLHTIKAYEDDLNAFLAFCQTVFEADDLEGVHYHQVRSWIVSLSEEGKTNRTINRKISSLKAYYRFLLKIQAIDQNPLAKYKALKVAKKVQVPFSASEISEVIENLESLEHDFESVRNKLIVELFYATGMRRSELIQLKISDVDFSNETIKVLGKRNKERLIPLIKPVQTTIQNYLELRKEITSKAEELLISKKGVKIYGTLVYRVINDYFSKVSSKVKKSPHVIRHSFATHLLNEGADLNSVKELLGHSSLASTQVYTNNSLNELKKVYNRTHPRSSKT